MAAWVRSFLGLISVRHHCLCIQSVSDAFCQEDLKGATQCYGFSLASAGRKAEVLQCFEGCHCVRRWQDSVFC